MGISGISVGEVAPVGRKSRKNWRFRFFQREIPKYGPVTEGPLRPAKFDPNRCSGLPMRGENPKMSF